MGEVVRPQSFHEVAPPSHPLRRATDHEPPPAMHPGWTPAHDDVSPKAADERARAALRGVYELRAELAEIGAAVRSLVKVLKILGLAFSPAVIAVVVDFARGGALWLTTLHH